MKLTILGATILSVLCFAETSPARQASIAPAAPPAPIPVQVAPARPGAIASQGTPAPEAPEAPDQPSTPFGLPGEKPGKTPKELEDLDQAKAKFEQSRAQYDAAQAQFDRGMSSYYIAQPDAARLWSTGTRGERSMVIRITDADPKIFAAMEEDLNIMGRILEKAVLQNGEDDQPKAMSIPLVTFGNHSQPNNLEIEGFGAVFFLNVNFPLAGPASNKSEESAKEPANSTWDEAKRELYGPPAGGRGQPDGASSVKEEYDPKRVEKLKDSLLDALKNGSNMRNLKSDENVTVVVTHNAGNGFVVGYQSRLTGVFGTSGGGSGSSGIGNVVAPEKPARRIGNGNGNGSTMTIRAKKSEIDAFAGGKLNLEEFRNKAKVLVY